MTTLLRLTADDIDSFHEALRPWVEHTAKHSGQRYDGDYLISKARKEDIQFWIVTENGVIKALFITEIIDFPEIREFRILTLTGVDMSCWVGLINQLEDFARTQNCARIGMMARPGWERVGARYAYVKTHVHLEKDL